MIWVASPALPGNNITNTVISFPGQGGMREGNDQYHPSADVEPGMVYDVLASGMGTFLC